MFVYQDGKLYVQDGDKIVGVEIYPDNIITVEGTETMLGTKFQLLTSLEVQSKFHITTTPYIFPRPKKEEVRVEETVTKGVDDNVASNPVKKSGRKSTKSK